MVDDLKIPQKSSSWSEAERERSAPPRDPDSMRPVLAECMHPNHFPNGYEGARKPGTCIDHEPTPERPALPPWVMSFLPETVIEHNSWEAVVRHVGYESGRWLVLIEPTRLIDGPRKAGERAEWRRLRAEVGKKEAWKIMRERHGKGNN
jgi:hypothetical protein